MTKKFIYTLTNPLDGYTNSLRSRLNTTNGYNISGVTTFDTTRNSLTNTRIGVQALNNNTTGVNNIAIGSEALLNNNASCNIAIGNLAMCCNTTGVHNIKHK